MKKILILPIICYLISTACAQEVDITIAKKGLSKVSIAVGEFSPSERIDSGMADKLLQVLISDLTLADYFNPVKSTTDAELLLKCTYALSGAEQLSIEGKLYETKKGTMLLGKRFAGTKNDHRKLVHSLSDSIVTAVFGGKGIAETRLTFEGAVNGVKQIFISDYDGANVVQLTKDQCPNLFPDLSPNGKMIVYTSYLNILPQTFVYNLGEGTRKKICGYPGINTSASFSPDGRKIALTLSKDGNPEIYIINADGTGLKRLTNDKAVDTSPCWSPDGNRIAFVSNRGGTPQIYVMDVSGGTAKRLTYTGSYNTNPSWSPNGDIIVYNSITGGIFQIYYVDVNTCESGQLTSVSGNCENPSFAPDGRHIVFSMGKGYNNSLYLMEIFYREPHKLEMKGGNYTNPDWGR